MTDRDELIEVMARSRAARDGYNWDDMPPYRDGYLSQSEDALAAAERAGFSWSKQGRTP